MPKNTFPTGIEEMVQNISDVPEPNAVFLQSLREQFIASGVVNAQKNKETNMSKISRRLFSPRLAWGFGIALLVVMLAMLAASPTVVNALKRIFGFMPGVGIVEQTSPLRILAEPFSVEREGILLKIMQVAADSDKTLIIYEYPVIEASSNPSQPPSTSGDERPALLLPDGTRLDVRVGRRMPTDVPNTILYALEFPPLPPDVSDATLKLPGLPGEPPGAGPESWSIPFHLIPAPAGTVLPLETATEPLTGTMTEDATSSATDSAGNLSPSSTPPITDSRYGITSRVISSIRKKDGYLLIGSVEWDQEHYPADSVIPLYVDHATVTDASGKLIAFEEVDGADVPPREEFRSYWAIKLKDADFKPPLKISLPIVDISWYDSPGPTLFRFDVGPDPQPGQRWLLNVDTSVAGRKVHFSAAELQRVEDSSNLRLMFTAQTEPNFLGDLYLSIPNVTQACGSGGYAIPTEASSDLQIYSGLCAPSDLTPGQHEVQFMGGLFFGPWAATWQP